MAVNVGLNEALILSAIGAAAGAAYAALVTFRRKIRLRAPTPDAVVWSLAGAYFVVFTALTLARHYGMATYGFDLGYYGNVIYQIGRGFLFKQTVICGEIYLNHCAPLLVALAPLTYVFRDPAYLLPIQALSLAAGIPLLYAIAKPEAGTRWPAAALAAGFALSPALHSANLYDFHPRALGVPLALAAIYLFREKNFRAGLIFAVLLALAQDDLALHAVALLLYGGVATGRRRAAVIAAAALAVYFVGVCLYLYPKLTYGTVGWEAHYLGYFESLTGKGVGAWGTAETWAHKGGYLSVLLLPIAAFLPAAGAALFMIATPLAVPVLTSSGTVFQIGWQYPLSILPFVYGAAALGLRRLVRPEAGWPRRLLIVGGSTIAVLLPLLFIKAFAGRYYRDVLRDAFPDAHDTALAEAAKRAPADVPLLADDVFVPHLAHRRFIYLYLSSGMNMPAPAEAALLDRRAHALTPFAAALPRFKEYGLAPVDVTGDYAYFERGTDDRALEDLFYRWFGTIEEWQYWAPEVKEYVADPRARDGRAKLVPTYCHQARLPGYVYPPGKYRLSFFLRPANKGEAGHANLSARVTSARDPSRSKVRRRVVKIRRSDDYVPYTLRVKSPDPFFLQLDLRTSSPLYFDATSIAGNNFTPEAVRTASSEVCP